MQLQSKDLPIVGNIHYQIIDPETGAVEESGSRENLVVSSGKNLICSRLIGNDLDPIGYLGIGSGQTAPLLSDVQLVAEKSRRPVTVDPIGIGNKITFWAVFPAGFGDGAISEAGLFNALNGGVMLSRSSFLSFNKPSNKQLVIMWEIIVG